MSKAFVMADEEGGGGGAPVHAHPEAGIDERPAPGKDLRPADLSIIIPTLNAAPLLPDTIHSLLEIREVMNVEIIVVDGGSSDDTVEKAAALGLRVVTSPRGRGVQLSAGAREARAPWLLFLHADTTLEPFWSTTVTSFMRCKGSTMKAAYFTFALDDPSDAARRIEVLANWRARRFGLPYGDQGLLMSRALYNSLVSFLDAPIMEDVDMVRRIGRSQLVELPATATTSAERYRRDGFWVRPLRNLSLLALYFMGVSPHRLARLYG